jgi:hypothetical protein
VLGLRIRGYCPGNAAMTLAQLAQDFSAAVGAEVRLDPIGARDVRVFVPFEFPDGDRLVIRLRETGDAGYELTGRLSRLPWKFVVAAGCDGYMVMVVCASSWAVVWRDARRVARSRSTASASFARSE